MNPEPISYDISLVHASFASSAPGRENAPLPKPVTQVTTRPYAASPVERLSIR